MHFGESASPSHSLSEHGSGVGVADAFRGGLGVGVADGVTEGVGVGDGVNDALGLGDVFGAGDVADAGAAGVGEGLAAAFAFA